MEPKSFIGMGIQRLITMLSDNLRSAHKEATKKNVRWRRELNKVKLVHSAQGKMANRTFSIRKNAFLGTLDSRTSLPFRQPGV